MISDIWFLFQNRMFGCEEREKINFILSIAVAGMLVGCGSSSSSDSEQETPTDPQLSEEAQNTSDNEAPSSATLNNVEYIEGIYDISRSTDAGTDLVYLSIDSTGLIATYDYVGDSVDNQDNCYIKNHAQGYNTDINGLRVTNNEQLKAFTVDSGYQWNYGDGTSISTVSISGISAGSILSMNGTRIATSGNLTTAVTLSELEQSLCQ